MTWQTAFVPFLFFLLQLSDMLHERPSTSGSVQGSADLHLCASQATELTDSAPHVASPFLHMPFLIKPYTTKHCELDTLASIH